MGSFIGHILPGTLFLLVGVWHIWCSVVRYVSNPKTFQVRAWNPVPGFEGRLKYLELYVISIGAFIDLCVELLVATQLKFFVGGVLNSTYLNNFEHSGMLLMFLIFGVVSLLSEKTRYIPLPEGALCLIAATAFTAEYLLFNFHSATHKGLEGYYHVLLAFLIGLCILSSIAGAVLPTCFPVDLCKGIGITLQGIWFYQTAFVLFGPMLPSGCSMKDNVVTCHSKESEVRGELLANVQLFSAVLAVHVGTIASFGFALFCGNCPALGLNQPICTRGQPVIPTSAVNGLPFNKYSWIVTHNAFSIVDSPPLPGVQRLTFYNQEDTVTNQLRNGVRGLMLDMYDFENDIWLCHSFQGKCFNFTAFQPAINTLKEVEAFLTQNPTEIVTIIIEDYVHTPKGLTNLFTIAGLDKYWFPVSKMPKKGNDWPTVTEMVQANHRLVVFTSDASKEAGEGIAYQWKHMVENESGDPGVQKGNCPHRKESKALNSKSSSLFLMNYFPTYPVQADSCKEHSAPLAEMVNTCYKAAGNVVPNFIAVNFYMRSDGGGVFDIVDKMNGHSLCGCSTVAACQAGASFGSCKNISVPNTSPVSNTGGVGSFNGSVQFSKSASPVHYPNCVFVFLFYFLLIAVLLKL